jgi:hypothetical protein
MSEKQLFHLDFVTFLPEAGITLRIENKNKENE